MQDSTSTVTDERPAAQALEDDFRALQIALATVSSQVQELRRSTEQLTARAGEMTDAVQEGVRAQEDLIDRLSTATDVALKTILGASEATVERLEAVGKSVATKHQTAMAASLSEFESQLESALSKTQASQHELLRAAKVNLGDVDRRLEKFVRATSEALTKSLQENRTDSHALQKEIVACLVMHVNKSLSTLREDAAGTSVGLLESRLQEIIAEAAAKLQTDISNATRRVLDEVQRPLWKKLV